MPEVRKTHHVKLGDSYLLLHPNSYNKRAAPRFGARFATGDPSYDNLSFWQHWVQSCWVGGMGEPSWEDDSMYDYGVGVDTSSHDLVALSRGLEPGGGNHTLTGKIQRRHFFVWDDRLHCLLERSSDGNQQARIWRLGGDDNWFSWKVFGNDKEARTVAKFAGDLFVGLSGRYLKRRDNGNWKNVAKPKKRNETPFVMRAYRGRLYVGFGRYLYRLKPNGKWDGNAVFFDGQDVSHYIDAEFHQGFLYLLTQNGHVIRTDGNATYDIHQFGGQCRGMGLKSYDGKLFITTQEWYDDEFVGDMVLYQMSGAAVTELRRYGRVGKATASSAMAVVNRTLLYGASALLGVAEDQQGFGIALYDAREDAHSLFASERDVTTYPDNIGSWKGWAVDDMIKFGGNVYISVRGHGIFRASFSPQDIERGIATFDGSWEGEVQFDNDEGGVLVSSEFDAGTPGLRKLWRKVTVTADLLDEGVSVLASYSIDGGHTWVELGEMTKTGPATRYSEEFFLAEGVRSERFKYKLQLDTDDPAHSPFVRSVVVAFVPSPEPNWMWTFTAILSDRVELLDGTEVEQDVDALKAALEAAFREDELVYFQDVDRQEWTPGGSGVLIEDIVFSAPLIGHEDEGDIEYTVQVQLLEAVESYPSTVWLEAGFDVEVDLHAGLEAGEPPEDP